MHIVTLSKEDIAELSEIDQIVFAKMEKDGVLTEFLESMPEGFIDTLKAANKEQQAEAQQQQREDKERHTRQLSRMSTNAPYKSPLLNHSLVQYLANNDIIIDDVDHALKSMALVGVLLPDTPLVKHKAVHAKDLWRDDLDMIHNVAKNFSNAGIPLHPEVSFTIYNLLPPVSSDFLMNAHPCAADMDLQFPDADAVLISSIPKYGATPMHHDYEVDRGYTELTADAILAFRNCGMYTSVSRLHDEQSVWAEAAFNLGAKFIAVRGGTGDEVSTEHLQDHDQSTMLIESTSSSNKLAYVARKDALPNYAAHVCAENPLGIAIQNALN